MRKFKLMNDDTELIVFPTIGDGSCFFHSLCFAINREYQLGDPTYRKAYVRKLRRELSNLLIEERYPGISWYETLGGGELDKFSVEFSGSSLEGMISTLDSSDWVSNLFNEYVSEVLDIDIYIVDVERRTLYNTGDDLSKLYKNRLSVIIGYMESQGHYSTICRVLEDEVYQTSFRPDDEVIRSLKKFFPTST